MHDFEGEEAEDIDGIVAGLDVQVQVGVNELAESLGLAECERGLPALGVEDVFLACHAPRRLIRGLESPNRVLVRLVDVVVVVVRVVLRRAWVVAEHGR